MKIAIHHRSGSFSDRWIAYCKRENIPFKIVNCFDTNIVAQLEDCDALLWHHHQGYFKDVLVAKKILFALEHAGIQVFPNFKTNWHFDDKVAQKYLLEAIEAPLVPSYVFYDKKEALEWVDNTIYPKVFKLTGGAGAANVKLVRTKSEARKLINKAFGKGYSQFNRWGHLKDRYKKYKSGRDTLLGVVKGVGRLFIPTEYTKMQSRERGYVYFQEFIPNNTFDIRVIIAKDKAFALKRMTRENDFRASGSGKIIYDKSQIDERCIIQSFETSKKLDTQSVAFDFVFDKDNNPLIIEISYGFAIEAYDDCPGYWDSSLIWHEGRFIPQDWMVEQLIEQIK